MTKTLKDFLMQIIGLAEKECSEVLENPEKYGAAANKLLETYRDYMKLVKTRSELESRAASLKSRHSEIFMDVHRNAIILSSLRSNIQLLGLSLDQDKLRRLNEILEEYLMIHF